MTRIEAIIAPHHLDLVKETLASLGLSALTSSEVKGALGTEARGGISRGAATSLDLLPAVKLEVVVPAPFVPRVLDALERAARGGAFGGRLLASPVLQAVRIRTGERGEAAL